jgi:hypothetical protein
MRNKVLQVFAYANNIFYLFIGRCFTYEPIHYLSIKDACQASVRDLN